MVLVAERTGGCAMRGPNCERFVVYGDGTVETYRAGESDPRPADVGSIDPALVVTLRRAVGNTDLQALGIRLPAGECQGCLDGIDTVATFTIDGNDTTFNSIETELPSTEPAFAAMWAVIDACRTATDVPLTTR